MAELFRATLETSNLSEFSGSDTGGGRLYVTSAGPLHGSYSLAVNVNYNTTPIYAYYSGGSAYTNGTLRIGFFLDPNGITMAADSEFSVAMVADGSANPVAFVFLHRTAGGSYALYTGLQIDSGGHAQSVKVNISNARHWIELLVVRATGASTNNGYCTLYIDGAQAATNAGRDNYSAFNDWRGAYFGAVSGVDATTGGSPLKLDCIVVRNDGTEIGQPEDEAPAISGSLAVTLGAAALSASGGAAVQGSVTATLGAATLSAAGSTTAVEAIGGSLAVVLGAAALSAAGRSAVRGSLSVTLGAVTLSAAGSVEMGAPVLTNARAGGLCEMNGQAFSVRFERRDFSGPRLTPGLRVSVERMTWRALGGPWQARLVARAADGARLWQCADLLRCGVKVFDELGAAWWGYVAAVTLHTQAGRMRISLDDLANDVRVRYKNLSPDPWGGEEAYTAAAVDAASVAVYGRRQQVAALGPATLAQAEATRAAVLARQAWPGWTAGPGGAEWNGSDYAIIECRGWWETLDWLYYADGRGMVGNQALGSSVKIGATAAAARFAQSFSAGAEGWNATEVWVRLSKEGSPGYLKLALLADNAGSPGALLQNAADVFGAPVATERVWQRFVLAAPVALAAGGSYWVQLQREVIDANNYYNLSVDFGLGYAGGVLRVWNGAAWAANTPDGDLSFVVRGTAAQDGILTRMAAQCGQFLAGARLETGLGFEGIAYRDGSQRGRAEVEGLLRQGTAAGENLLARVEADRWLRVYARPDAAGAELRLQPGGGLAWRDGRRLHCSEQAAGRWARMESVHGGAIAGAVATAGALFVAGCAWDAERGLRLSEEGD